MVKLNAGGGLSGAASGAYAGSAFGPVGAVAGGLIGGAAGLFGGGAKKKRKPKKLSTLDERQQEIYGNYTDAIAGKGPLAGLYNFDAEGAGNVFDQTVGRPQYRNFQEKVIPGITGQFRQDNLGRSSYAGQALANAGRDVQEGLDAERARYMYQGQQDATRSKQNAIDRILGMQTFAYQQPEEQGPGAFDQVLSGLGQGAGKWLANGIGGDFFGGGGNTPAPGGGGNIPNTNLPKFNAPQFQYKMGGR